MKRKKHECYVSLEVAKQLKDGTHWYKETQERSILF